MPDQTIANNIPPGLLKADNLPSIPAVAVEVLRLTQDEEATIEDLAQTLSRDPALAGKLLKLSNSSLFNPGYAITTMQRASMVLGMKTVRLMALSFSLAGSLPTEGDEDGFDFQEYWKRSLVNAVAARALGERLDQPMGDEAFLCGLLGHIGRMVMAECLPDGEYDSVVAETSKWPTYEQEESYMGFNNADVVCALLRSWELPAEVYVPILHRGNPDGLRDDDDEMIVTLTNTLSTALAVEEVLCGDNAAEALKDLGEKARRHFGFTEERLDQFLVSLETGVSEAAEMLNVTLPKGTAAQDIIDQARLQIVNVSMGLNVELRQANRRSEELEGKNRELHTVANTDKLTGLANRKRFDDFLAQQIRDRLNGSVPRALGLVMVDVDRFKSFNDTHGHDAGDEVLRMVGSVLANATRKGDVPARYGGEEFAVILPQTTPFALRAAAERLRAEIEKASLEYEGKVLRVTASFGGVCVVDVVNEEDGKRLVKLADHYLYKAKENGRNRSEIAQRIVKLPRR